MLEVASECATHPFTISHYIFSHIVRRVFVRIKLTINMKMVLAYLHISFCRSVSMWPCVRSNGKLNAQIKIITIPIHFLSIFSVPTSFVDFRFDSKYNFFLCFLLHYIFWFYWNIVESMADTHENRERKETGNTYTNIALKKWKINISLSVSMLNG